MPKKSATLPQDRELHGNVLREWREWIETTKKRRSSVRLRLTSFKCRHLYSSALSRSSARLNLYSYDSPAGTSGQLVQANNGSSLYDLAVTDYLEVFRRSTPLIRLWPFAWLRARLNRFAPVLVIFSIAIVLGLFAGSVGLVLAGVLSGLLGQALVDRLPTPLWTRQRLFK